jgi:hypothetical protein
MMILHPNWKANLRAAHGPLALKGLREPSLAFGKALNRSINARIKEITRLILEGKAVVNDSTTKEE